MGNKITRISNQYRAHGGIGYKPPVWWYAGTCPKVKGLGGLWGLETVAHMRINLRGFLCNLCIPNALNSSSG